jgi:spore coat protein U-like protein
MEIKMTTFIKKIIFLLPILIGNSCFAQNQCSLSVQPAHLGTYNFSSGNTTTINMISTCNTPTDVVGSLLWLGSGRRADYYVNLTNGTSNITATFTSSSIDWGNGTGVYDNIPACTNISPYYGSTYMGAGSGIFCSTITIPSGTNLTPGLYIGTTMSYYQFFNDTGGRYTNPYPVTLTLTVQNSCAISTSGITFGTYNNSQITSSTTVNSLCTQTTPYTISLNSGSSGNINSRTMKNGSASLNYNIYSDPSYVSVLGDGITGGKINLIGTGFLQSTNVYGKIPAGQQPTPGNYSDTLEISLTY